ncbi:MAG TPA: amidohydrolase [Candidatus Dormibacteraeota bacterium]|nr:amidohydrolase [Candidatus Dormibacteraeota bacterium]
MTQRPVLFAGCKPEVAAGPDRRILAVGAGARAAAGRGAEVVRLRGHAWPGLVDAHIHLESLADRNVTLDLGGTRSLEATLTRIERWSKSLPKTAWVVGAGWYNDAWPDPAFPTRHHLDRAAGGRPVYLRRKDGHSAWVSSAAVALAGVDATTPDPPGGVIDRDAFGELTGIVRELAMNVVARVVPPPTEAELDSGMSRSLARLSRLGLTGVHSMDSARGLASLQRLHARGQLPLRVTYNLPLADLRHAERMGVRSGWGDEWLRFWGVKAFLDGSLGSRTAEMLDGSGTPRLTQPELEDMIERCVRAELNVCLHAIGDGAVHRALDALQARRRAWSKWRPRIEHAQCVHPKDQKRFASAGVIASMQPIHAVSDRDLADAEWASVTAHAYAWGALQRAGVRLAFGSDAPVETADPLLGIDAATAWRRRARWHPELAVTRASALRAYTTDAAYAVGMEDEVGSVKPGFLCDLTVVLDGKVEATVVGGRVRYRTPAAASPRSASGSRSRSSRRRSRA